MHMAELFDVFFSSSMNRFYFIAFLCTYSDICSTMHSINALIMAANLVAALFACVAFRQCNDTLLEMSDELFPLEVVICG